MGIGRRVIGFDDADELALGVIDFPRVNAIEKVLGHSGKFGDRQDIAVETDSAIPQEVAFRIVAVGFEERVDVGLNDGADGLFFWGTGSPKVIAVLLGKFGHYLFSLFPFLGFGLGVKGFIC